jgi:hypothetical protein
MHRLLFVALVLLAAAARADSCLPRLDLPQAWTSCTGDSECTLAGDGCRTCTAFLVVNRKHKADAEALDARRRAEIRCALACEACSTAGIKLECAERVCRVRAVRP